MIISIEISEPENLDMLRQAVKDREPVSFTVNGVDGIGQLCASASCVSECAHLKQVDAKGDLRKFFGV